MYYQLAVKKLALHKLKTDKRHAPEIITINGNVRLEIRQQRQITNQMMKKISIDRTLFDDQ
jgi:hypothetical protein